MSAWDDGAGIRFGVQTGPGRSLTLPCGQCIECRLDRSRQWALRCMHEASMHDFSCFVTLTYDDGHLPEQGQLVYWHFQDFMKRLRKRFGSVRFFCCGEYGALHDRPHFHACLFGLRFPDLVFLKGTEFRLYTSAALDSLWTHGGCTVGDVTFESAQYVAGYVVKKVTGDAAGRHYSRVSFDTGEVYSLTPEFARMSLKPGIGGTWIQKFVSDVFPKDLVVSRGREMKPPRYYDQFAPDSDRLEFDRYQKFCSVSDDCSPSRLLAREKVTKARLAFKRRCL